MDFISQFPYNKKDKIIDVVFEFGRALFLEIYDFRNVLVHESWASSEEFPGVVLFSSLDEESRLKLASGKLLHSLDTSSKDLYDATIRYIRNVKIVSNQNLMSAIIDADLCSYIFMAISHILSESDEEKKQKIREGFLIFKGTAHLFEEASLLSKKIDVTSSNNNTIHH